MECEMRRLDGAKALVGSANFTEAAQFRNIEIGLVTYRPGVAATVERHFEELTERGYLRGLPLSDCSRCVSSRAI